MNIYASVLDMQKALDEAVGAARENGFVPGERSRVKILLSAIAECIEFNEETEGTHKTWKQRKPCIEHNKVLEELTDILFFIAQFANRTEHNQDVFVLEFMAGNRHHSVFKMYQKEALTLKLIERLAQGDIGAIVSWYKATVSDYGFTMEGILEEYERKWHINMARINGDWSIKK